MARSSSRPGERNLKPAHPNEGDDERWKTSPTRETPGDQGENARKDARQRHEENTPDRGTAAPDTQRNG
jgi:hypothetical protein